MKKCHRLARIAVAVTALQFAASTVWADTCASPAEKTAFDTRVLQSELMVAALSCGENARYNNFVQKFESELVANGKALRGYFARNYGKSGEDVLDRFITRIANNAATRRMQQPMPQYCASAVTLFTSVLASDISGLHNLVSQPTFSEASGVSVCTVEALRDQTN